MIQPPDPPILRHTYYPVLDLIRGIAILIITLYHLFYTIALFRFGWIGVDLFFVLSGFLITASLLKARGHPFFFRNFYTKRILRTFPLYYLTITAFFFFGQAVFTHKNPGSAFYFYDNHQNWFWLLRQNWLFIQEGVPSMPYLVHLWSLAVEEQFYLIWPVVVVITRTNNFLKKLIVILFCLVVTYRLFVCFGQSTGFVNYYHNTLTRSDSLLAGSFIAVLHYEDKKIPTSVIQTIIFAWIIMLVYLITVYGNINPDNMIMGTFGYSMTAMAFSSILYRLLASSSIKFYKFTIASPLIYLGKISYSIYLFHIPVFLTIGKLLSSFTNVPRYAIGLYSLSAILLISSFSYFLIERPILSLKRYFQ